MSRTALANRRNSLTFTMQFQGERYHVTVGFYGDSRIGEVFINRILGKSSAKINTILDGVCRDSAILMSLALQHGVDLDTMMHAVTRDEDGEPSTIIGAIVDRLVEGV